MDVKTAATDSTQELNGFPGYVFSGDRELALSLIPSVQNLLYHVRSFIASSGARVYGLTRAVGDSIIRVSSNAGIETVEIMAMGEAKDESASLDGVEILSGVTKNGEILTITPPIIGAASFETLRSYKPTAQAYKYPLKKRPGNYPKTIILPGNTFEDQPRLAVPDYGLVALPLGYENYTYSGKQSVALGLVPTISAILTAHHAAVVGGSRLEGYYILPGGVGYYHIRSERGSPATDHVYIFTEGERQADEEPVVSPYDVIAPSMYSGLMAKAAQVILGYGKLRTRGFASTNKTTDVKLKYDWRWARCHGIVRGAGKELWLVEISVTHGVLAMPLPLFANTVKGGALHKALLASEQDVLRETTKLFGGLPSGRTFPPSELLPESPEGTVTLAEAIAAGDVLVLATPSAMSEFYAKYTHSAWLGWTFNIGSEGAQTVARNTCFDSTDYVYGYHYSLTFSIGAINKNRDPGDPIAVGSAALALVENGRIYSQMSFYDGDTLTPGFVQNMASPIDVTPYTTKTPLLVTHVDDAYHVVWAEVTADVALSYFGDTPITVDPVYGSLAGRSSQKTYTYYENDDITIISIDEQPIDPFVPIGETATWGTEQAVSVRAVCSNLVPASSLEQREVTTATIGEATAGAPYVTSGWYAAHIYLDTTNVDYFHTESSWNNAITEKAPAKITEWTGTHRDAYLFVEKSERVRTHAYTNVVDNPPTAAYPFPIMVVKAVMEKTPVVHIPDPVYEYVPPTAGLGGIYDPRVEGDILPNAREVSNIRCSMFGPNRLYSYADHIMNYAGDTVRRDSTIGVGDMLTSETAPADTNYSFIGYI